MGLYVKIKKDFGSFILDTEFDADKEVLGILGEYLGRVFEEVKHRPLYLIARGKPKDEDF